MDGHHRRTANTHNVLRTMCPIPAEAATFAYFIYRFSLHFLGGDLASAAECYQ